MTLGSLIRHYKYKRHRKGFRSSADKHQILDIIKRLEDYKIYQKTLIKKRKHTKKCEQKKALTRIKRDSYRRAYPRKPVYNPYIYMYEKHSIAVDPRLEQRYKSKPVYYFYEFRHLRLPRSNYTVQAGPAWGALIKSWKGYKIAKSQHNLTNMKLYAYTTQKWADMLELPMVPDFRCASLEGFYNSKKLMALD